MLRLPSLDALRAFEAAARHLSFTKAAHELHVTQSALSQRIGALEDELGYALFERAPRGLALTRRGRVLAEAMGRALAEIGKGFDALAPGAAASRLRLTTLPSFAACWLVPRLPKFAARHPDIEVQVEAGFGVVDLRAGEIDLAVRFGTGRYDGLAARMLMDDLVEPVCAPALLARHGALAGARDLLDRPLLYDTNVEKDASGTDWKTWFAAAGIADAPLPAGLRFSQADHALQAAVRGLGFALARHSLAAQDLASGALVAPLPALRLKSRYAYFLVTAAGARETPATAAFRRWLEGECRDFVALRDGAAG